MWSSSRSRSHPRAEDARPYCKSPRTLRTFDVEQSLHQASFDVTTLTRMMSFPCSFASRSTVSPDRGSRKIRMAVATVRLGSARMTSASTGSLTELSRRLQ